MPRNNPTEAFLSYQKASEKSPHTLKSYRSDLVQFTLWFERSNYECLRLSKITPTDIRQYKQYLIKKAYKPQTINRRLCVLNFFLQWGYNTKKIKYRLPMPKFVKQMQTAPKWLSKVEQHALLRQMERLAKPRDIAIVKILLNTGLRVQELCNLIWKNITLTERKGALIIQQGKGNKYREVPLNKTARNAFELLGYQEYAGTDTPVFLGQRGTLTPRGIQMMLQRQLKDTQLSKITLHQLRHTFCKNLVDAGISLEKVAALAGHESLNTTRLYCQPSLSDLSEAVEQIGEEE
jgi:integrase/recombinase XerC